MENGDEIDVVIEQTGGCFWKSKINFLYCQKQIWIEKYQPILWIL